MTNEAKILIRKRCSKAGDVLKELPSNAPTEEKILVVRNVWNSRETVELQVGDLRIEVDARDLNTAVDNAIRSARF